MEEKSRKLLVIHTTRYSFRCAIMHVALDVSMHQSKQVLALHLTSSFPSCSVFSRMMSPSRSVFLQKTMAARFMASSIREASDRIYVLDLRI